MNLEERSEPLFETIFAGDSEANRSEQIFRRFKKYFADNPRVWSLFQQFAFQVINSGRAHYSADAILHRIRWHVDIETTGDSVKINNDHAAYFARLFAVAYPAHADFFEQRRRTSADRAAKPLDPSVNYTGTPVDEAGLVYELTQMAHLNSSYR